jgi:hypothetical protein
MPRLVAHPANINAALHGKILMAGSKPRHDGRYMWLLTPPRIMGLEPQQDLAYFSIN